MRRRPPPNTRDGGLQNIIYEWSTDGAPVQKKQGVGDDLPNFYLDERIETSDACTSKTNTGSLKSSGDERLKVDGRLQATTRVFECGCGSAASSTISFGSFT